MSETARGAGADKLEGAGAAKLQGAREAKLENVAANCGKS